eukprot:scaffold81137_cov52-Attheya_sp.AAC.7
MATLPGNLITTPATPRRLGPDGPQMAPLTGGSQGQDAEAAAAAVVAPMVAPMVVAPVALPLVSTRPRGIVQTRTRAAGRAKALRPRGGPRAGTAFRPCWIRRSTTIATTKPPSKRMCWYKTLRASATVKAVCRRNLPLRNLTPWIPFP